MGNRKDQALLEPSMDSVKLNDGVDPQVFANRIKPTSVWRAFFTAEAERVERNDNVENATRDQSWEDVESPSLEKLSEVDFAYQTPKRLKVGILLEALADTIPVGVVKTESLELIKDPMLVESGPVREAAVAASIRTVLAEWKKVCAGFNMVNDDFSKLGSSESKYRDAISSTVVRIHKAIQEADARTALLAARVGRDNTDASDLGSETVWEAIRRLCDAMGEVQKQSSLGAMERDTKAAITQL
jgi:hypothetical protein